MAEEKPDKKKPAGKKKTTAKKKPAKQTTASKTTTKAKKPAPQKKPAAPKKAAEKKKPAPTKKPAAPEKAAEKEKPAPKKPVAPKKASKADGLHLITGFPGFIGRRLVLELGKLFENARFALLVQGHLLHVAEEAVADLNDQVPGLADRTELVVGDITLSQLGLSDDVHKRMVSDVNVVWHLAAIYDLSVGPRVAYRVNVIGTANVLDFCEMAHSLFQLNYTSTCYVAGDRTGLVLESELDEGQGHKNHYESTKFWAEVEVQRRWDRLPTAIFRPGIVVGDSKTGGTDKYDGPYYLIQLLLKLPGWLPMFHIGAATAPVNIVPVDFVVDSMVAIGQSEDPTGKVYQLGDHNPMRARDIIELLLKVLNRRKPLFSVSDKFVNWLLGNEKVRQLMQMPQEVVIYFAHFSQFDVSNTLEALEGTGVRCPHLSTYMRTLVDYVRRNPKKQFLDKRTV